MHYFRRILYTFFFIYSAIEVNYGNSIEKVIEEGFTRFKQLPCYFDVPSDSVCSPVNYLYYLHAEIEKEQNKPSFNKDTVKQISAQIFAIAIEGKYFGFSDREATLDERKIILGSYCKALSIYDNTPPSNSIFMTVRNFMHADRLTSNSYNFFKDHKLYEVFIEKLNDKSKVSPSPLPTSLKALPFSTSTPLRPYFEVSLDKVRSATHKNFERIKGTHNIANPTIFISYAWEDDVKAWVAEILSQDLKRLGFEVLLDQNYIRPGIKISDFEVEVSKATYVLVLCTPKYVARYSEHTPPQCSTGVGREVEMIQKRIQKNDNKSVFLMYLKGTFTECVPKPLQSIVAFDILEKPDSYTENFFFLSQSLFSFKSRGEEPIHSIAEGYRNITEKYTSFKGKRWKELDSIDLNLIYHSVYGEPMDKSMRVKKDFPVNFLQNGPDDWYDLINVCAKGRDVSKIEPNDMLHDGCFDIAKQCGLLPKEGDDFYIADRRLRHIGNSMKKRDQIQTAKAIELLQKLGYVVHQRFSRGDYILDFQKGPESQMIGVASSYITPNNLINFGLNAFNSFFKG